MEIERVMWGSDDHHSLPYERLTLVNFGVISDYWVLNDAGGLYRELKLV